MKYFLLIAMIVMFVFGAEERNDYAFTPHEAIAFSSIGFTLEGGEIKVNPLGGWADGIYQLSEAIVTPTEMPNTFIADLVFTKKKGMMNYTYDEKIGILHDGYRFWIKYHDRIYRYSVPQAVHSLDHHKKSTPKNQQPTLDIEIETMRLRFGF